MENNAPQQENLKELRVMRLQEKPTTTSLENSLPTSSFLDLPSTAF